MYGKILTTEGLIKEMTSFNWIRKPSEFHLHHTWKPTHHSFNYAVGKYGKEKAYITLVDSMRNYHVNTNKWDDIAQHLTLMPDGMWVIGRDWNKNPISMTGRNSFGFALEMVGNFDTKGAIGTQQNTLGYDNFNNSKQEHELRKLLRFFFVFFKLDSEKDLVFHSDYSSKTCPGNSIRKGDIMIGENKPNTLQEQVDALWTQVFGDNNTEEEVIFMEMKYGLKGENVKEWQMMLNRLGDYRLVADGSFGNLTLVATKDFQSKRGMINNGVVGSATYNMAKEMLLVNPNPPIVKPPSFVIIKKWAKGNNIEDIQQMFNKIGFSLVVDGSYGNGMQAVVTKFQKMYGLTLKSEIDKILFDKIVDIYNFTVENIVEFWHDKQTKIIKIRKNAIKMRVIMGKQPTESIHGLYNRLQEKPMFLMNGGMFGMSNGITLQYVKSYGELITEGVYSKYAMCQYDNGDIKLQGMYWAKEIGELDSISDAIGASPTLVISEEQRIDNTGLDYGFINNPHPRLAIGNDADWFYIVMVHGRDEAKGYFGLTIPQLANLGMRLKITHFINLDGGGSIKVLNHAGGEEDNVPGNRYVDHMVALFRV